MIRGGGDALVPAPVIVGGGVHLTAGALVPGPMTDESLVPDQGQGTDAVQGTETLGGLVLGLVIVAGSLAQDHLMKIERGGKIVPGHWTMTGGPVLSRAIEIEAGMVVTTAPGLLIEQRRCLDQARLVMRTEGILDPDLQTSRGKMPLTRRMEGRCPQREKTDTLNSYIRYYPVEFIYHLINVAPFCLFCEK